MNSAWGATKVKYHILTKPFTVMNYNNTGVFEYRSNIRVEALLCESEETTIGLPEQFISPLATNFRYWTATKSDATKKQQPLYDYGHGTKIINVKYDIYLCTAENKYACFEGDSIPKGSPVGSYTDIYVTYDYINDDKSVGYKNGILELDGGTDYNVSIMNGVEKFMCYNRSRNNRVANAQSAGLSGEDLASDEFVKPQDGTAANQLGWNYSKWGPQGMVLDDGLFFACDAALNESVVRRQNVSSAVLGGEGLFNTVITGPGKVYLQSHPLSTLAESIRPYIRLGN